MCVWCVLVGVWVVGVCKTGAYSCPNQILKAYLLKVPYFSALGRDFHFLKYT